MELAVSARRGFIPIVTIMASLLTLLSTVVVAADQPFLDTVLRPGTPLYARLKLPEKLLNDRSGYLRLPDQEEISSQGLSWTPLQASLELVPKIGSPTDFYLTSGEAVPSEYIEISLVWENARKKTLLSFSAHRVNSGTKIMALAQQDLPISAPIFDSSVSGKYSNDQIITPASPSDSRDLSADGQFNINKTKRTEFKKDIHKKSVINDELSEKLKKMLAAETPIQSPIEYQANTIHIDDIGYNHKNTDSYQSEKKDSELSIVNVNTGDVSAEEVEKNQPANNQVANNQDSKNQIASTLPVYDTTSTSTQIDNQPFEINPIKREEILAGTSLPLNSLASPILARNFSLLEIFLLVIAVWLVLISRYIFSSRPGVLDTLSPVNTTAQTESLYNNRQPSVNVDTTIPEKEKTLPSSILANVLRQAAEQAEEVDVWESQLHIDTRRANLATAEQQTLFQCASRLQDIRARARSIQMRAGNPFDALDDDLLKKEEIGSRNNQQLEPSSNEDQQQKEVTVDTETSSAGKARPSALVPQVKKASPFISVKKNTTFSKQKEGNSGLDDTSDMQDTPNQVDEGRAESADLESEYSEELSLASVYMNMGEIDTARSLLEDIIKNGNNKDKVEAEEIMRQIGDD